MQTIALDKVCCTCKETKSLNCFSKDSGSKDGLCHQCKSCIKKYKEENKEYFKNYAMEYRKANPEKIKAYEEKYGKTLIRKIGKWKTGAKRRGIDWSIENLVLESMPMLCHYTGLELTLEPHKTNTISLDRLDSSLGYVVGNVVFCCSEINLMKRKLSVSEFVNFCNLVSKFQGEKNVN